MILQKRTLQALCFLVVDCGFKVHLKQLLHIIVIFRYSDAPLLIKIYYQHVRNAVLDYCAKSVPVWGKSGQMRELLRGKNYLDMSSLNRYNSGTRRDLKKR